MNKLLKLICGTSEYHAYIFTAGKEYVLHEHSGALRWRIRCAINSVKNWPGDVRWRFANRLSWLAMRLRGDKPIEGFHCLQNRAADLEDRIFHPLICTGESVTLTKEECDDMIQSAHELGKLAHATTYVDYWTK